MAGKPVEEVKFLHGGVAIHHLRTYGEIFERELKLTGQVDYARKCGQGISAFYRELHSVKSRQVDCVQDDGSLLRAILIYSNEFFQMISKSNSEEAKKVAELLVECLDHGYIAELLIDGSIRQAIDDFFTLYGVQRPPQAKPIDSSNYIPNMDHGALTEAIFKQWFGPNAKLSDVFGGAEAMDVDENAYKPDEVRIIHFGLNREDTLRPLGRAFEDDVDISGQATYDTYKKRNKHPSDIIVKDMKKVKTDVEDQAHGVLMWDINFMQVLQEAPEAKKTVEELLQEDGNIAPCCRQFANVLMTDVDLAKFQTFSPILYRILAEPNRVVRLKNCLGKDHQSINFQDLARAVYKVWIGGQSSPSNLPGKREAEPVHEMEQSSSNISAQTGKSREPVESEYHSGSGSSLELELQDISAEPSKTPQMHSMEVNGPASSRGRSSDGSCETNQPVQNRGAVAQGGTATVASRFVPAVQGANTTRIRSVHQPTSVGSTNALKMFIPSGADASFDPDIAQRALHTNDISIKESRLDSLDAKISEAGLGLQQGPRSQAAGGQRSQAAGGQRLQAAGAVAGPFQGPASLRGPSLEDGAKNPVLREATQGGVNDVNRFASTKTQRSFPMDASNQVRPNQQDSQKWSLPRTVNKQGDVILGRDSLGTEVAKSSSAGMQTVSGDDEGRQMSVTGYKAPPFGSHGGQSLPNQSVTSSTQTHAHPASGDDGHLPSHQRWESPQHMLSGNAQGQSLLNQSVEKSPNEARSDLGQQYKMASGAYQKGAELLKDPQGEMALASGNAGGFQKMDQMEIAGNNQSSSSDINRSSDSQTSVQPNSSRSGPYTEASSLRSQDHHSMAVGAAPVQRVQPMGPGPEEMAMASGECNLFDRQDRQERNNSDQMISSGLRGTGVGQDSVTDPQQQQQQQRQQNPANGNGVPNMNGVPNRCKAFGDLREEAEEADARPNGAPPPYSNESNGTSQSMGCHPDNIMYTYNPKCYLQDGPMGHGRSVSVPSNFKPNGDLEGLFMNGGNRRKNNIGPEPVASVSRSSDFSDSNNISSLTVDDDDRKFIKDLHQDCIKKIKIVLDPLKSIIADWRNIAGKFNIDNDTINYWKSKPEQGKGPTEHLLEYLRHEKQDLTLDQFKEVLQHYKRYDVLDILKKQGY